MLKETTEERADTSSTPLHRQIHLARRARRLSQSKLAQEVGCKQSAISMFEGGHSHALSAEKLSAICELLDIPQAPATGEEPAPPPQSTPTGQTYCPQAECPSNIPYLVAEELRFLPAQQPFDAEAPFCRYCGELLEQHCPECNRPVTPGACCGGCGCAYVVGGPGHGKDQKDWVAAQRALALQVAARP